VDTGTGSASGKCSGFGKTDPRTFIYVDDSWANQMDDNTVYKWPLRLKNLVVQQVLQQSQRLTASAKKSSSNDSKGAADVGPVYCNF